MKRVVATTVLLESIVGDVQISTSLVDGKTNRITIRDRSGLVWLEPKDLGALIRELQALHEELFPPKREQPPSGGPYR